tara:strand:+ start:8 stop:1156 length:1149 start_codon:yes stop_codon:yes gene_type:complete
MNYKEFKESLKFRKYDNWKIIIRFIEYKFKNFLITILVSLNKYKYNSKKIIDLGSFKDNSYINFFLYSLKDEFIFTYRNDENVTKLFRRIGFVNFFKYTLPQSNLRNEAIIKINMTSSEPGQNEDNLSIDTNYYQYLYDKKNLSNKKNLLMPYFMYPRIYNSFYKKINIINKPNFNLRIFFSGSVVEEGYGNFYWKKEPEKFPNRVKTIKSILKEFKNEIFLINSVTDLKTSQFNKKKIIFCLHDKVIKKTSYKLNFKDNFNLLSQSCFNLSCPGVVMPLCHHLIEGIKVGSIPITNCEKLLIPNLNEEISLKYSNLDELIEKFYEALNMENDRIVYMRSKVQDYYKANLSPEIFKQNFKKIILDKKNKIICCDDHRSVKLI